MTNTEKKYALNLLTKTWIRDSYGLYDYESMETKNIHCLLSDSVFLVRKQNNIITNATNDFSQDDLFLNVKCEKNEKYIISNEIINLNDSTEKNK